ncbi:hypothetical protein D3C72_1259100 [compost metagenome]
MPGGQSVWHICPDGQVTDAPVETIQWRTPPEARVELAWVDDGMLRWVMRPADSASMSSFPIKDYSIYRSQCFDKESMQLYFIDVEQSYPSILAVQVNTGMINYFDCPDYNDYFDRYLRVSPSGTLVASSGMGVEIFSTPNGERLARFRSAGTSTTIEGIAVSDRHFLVVGFSHRDVALFIHDGFECWRCSGFNWNGTHFEFHYRSEHPFHVLRCWIDREDRLWLAGRDLAVFSKARECLFACQNYGHMLSGNADLVGVDDRGLAWVESFDGYTAFRIPCLTPQTLAPALAETGPRTGLEPVLGATEDDDLWRGLPRYYTS